MKTTKLLWLKYFLVGWVLLSLSCVPEDSQSTSSGPAPIAQEATPTGPITTNETVDIFDEGLKAWSTNKSPNIDLIYEITDSVTREGHKSLKLEYKFPRDRKSFWGFVDKNLELMRDWRRYDSIGFWCFILQPAKDLIDLSVMVYEADGSAYISQQVRNLKTTGWEEIIVPFSSFHISGEWTKDENGKLDLDQIKKVSIGIWQPTSFSEKNFTLFINNIRAIKASEASATVQESTVPVVRREVLQKFEPPENKTYAGVYAFSFPKEQPSKNDWEKQWAPEQISEFEIKSGRKVNLVGFFWFLDWEFPDKMSANIGSIGKTPIVGVLIGGMTTKDIAQGNQDKKLTDWARAAKAFGKPLFIRFLPEMNGNWHIYSEAKDPLQTHQNYVQAWRHVVEVFHREGADNVAWLWSPNSIDAGKIHWKDYYPGDDVVDWVGISVYSFLGNGDPEAQVLGVYNDYADRKPIMIAECSCGDADNNPKTYKPGNSYYDNPEKWINRFFDTLESKAPRVKAFAWFNIDRERVWKIQESPDKIEVFRKRIQNARYDVKLQ